MTPRPPIPEPQPSTDRVRPPRRRALAAAVAAAALLAGACGGSSDDAGGGGGGGGDLPDCPVDALESASGPVEIVVWHTYVAKTAETLERLAQEYNDSQDAVVVRIESQGADYGELWNKYQQGAAGGDLPAIAILEDINTQAVIDSGTIIPAQSCIDASDYDTSDLAPTGVDYYSREGVFYPGTLNMSTPLLYFNKNHFRKAGLDPEDPPGTLDELRDAAQAIKDAGVVTGTPLIINMSSWFMENWLTGEGQAVVDNDNGRGADETLASVMDAETTVELYTWVEGMVDDGLLTALPYNGSATDQYFAIAGQTASMSTETSTAATSIAAFLEGDTDIVEGIEGADDVDESAIDLEALDIGAGPFPGISEPGRVQVGGGAWYITGAVPDEQIAAAWDFIVWWNRPETQVQWHLDGSYLPFSLEAAAASEVVESWESTRSGRWLAISYDQLINGVDPDFPGPLIGPYEQFRDAVQGALDDVTLNGADPATAVADAQAEATAAIEQYNQESF